MSQARVVRQATPGDAPAVHDLLARCGRHLAETRGLTNWVPPYPLERLREECTPAHPVRRVFVVHEGETLVATFTLGSASPVAGDAAFPWRDDLRRPVYVNRLAVEPSRQGGGLGGWCTAEIERRAAEEGYDGVRLDALAANGELLAFYARRGYADRGRRTHGGREFACLSRPLPAVEPARAPR